MSLNKYPLVLMATILFAIALSSCSSTDERESEPIPTGPTGVGISIVASTMKMQTRASFPENETLPNELIKTW